MRGAKVLLAFMAVLAAGALAFGGVALAADEASKAPEGSKPAAEQSKAPEGAKATSPEAGKSVYHRMRAEVTAVDSNARTMTVKALRGKKEFSLDVTDKTLIREGKVQKTLSDIKVGDRVWTRYERTNDKLVADNIRILRPQHMAAKK